MGGLSGLTREGNACLKSHSKTGTGMGDFGCLSSKLRAQCIAQVSAGVEDGEGVKLHPWEVS